MFRHSVEECRAEMTKMETHMNNRENEKSELEKEVIRLKRNIENGEVTDNHIEEHNNPEGDNTPPEPNQQELEEQQRQEQLRREEEEKIQAEEQQRQEEEMRSNKDN